MEMKREISNWDDIIEQYDITDWEDVEEVMEEIGSKNISELRKLLADSTSYAVHKMIMSSVTHFDNSYGEGLSRIQNNRNSETNIDMYLDRRADAELELFRIMPFVPIIKEFDDKMGQIIENLLMGIQTHYYDVELEILRGKR
ncbi:MAG: hypothetical protein ACOCQD_00245 [archaeon]